MENNVINIKDIKDSELLNEKNKLSIEIEFERGFVVKTELQLESLLPSKDVALEYLHLIHNAETRLTTQNLKDNPKVFLTRDYTNETTRL